MCIRGSRTKPLNPVPTISALTDWEAVPGGHPSPEEGGVTVHSLTQTRRLREAQHRRKPWPLTRSPKRARSSPVGLCCPQLGLGPSMATRVGLGPEEPRSHSSCKDSLETFPRFSVNKTKKQTRKSHPLLTHAHIQTGLFKNNTGVF